MVLSLPSPLWANVQRLRDMGLLPGVGITVMGRSPMGDLLSLRVMGTTLALRVADAEDVTVSTDD